MDRRATTSGFIQLWIYLSCLSSCWAQMNAEQLLTTCRGLNSLQAVIGTEDSVSITCNHGPGGLVDLDWFLTSVNGPEDGTEITIDGVKYEGETPSIEINDISASDEGLYRCKYELQLARKGATVMGESEGQCLYVLARAQYQRCDPPSSTPCQETITAPPGSVTFNTNVEYVGGGSLGLIQLTRRLQLYRGEMRLSNQVLYSCNSRGNEQIPCTDALQGTVVRGDMQNKYDFSVQVQLDESGSGVYTAFVDVYDPIANSDYTLSKTFDVTITDINECDTDNGGCNQTCTNTIESFVCSCGLGYKLKEDQLGCNDINECDTDNGGCNQTCTNTIGSFVCSCGSGYELNEDGRGCNDINKCDTDNGGCNQTCTNTIGSFVCSCGLRYELNEDRLGCNEHCVPFHLHNELAYQIKLTLNNCSTDPHVHVEVPFDHFLFGGGLQQYGTIVKKQQGHDIYRINKYEDLAPILGRRWHVRVLNDERDFCYVELDTVQYYLHYRQPMVDLQPDIDCKYIHGGWVLVFRFVRGGGDRHQWDSFISME